MCTLAPKQRLLPWVQPEHAHTDTLPEHQAKAMDILQEKEGYLDDDCMVAFIDLFQVDTALADAYLAIKCEGLQRKWVEKKLVKALGFPLL